LSEDAAARVFALPGGPESIGAARAHTREFLRDVDASVSTATAQDALSAVSELVTNAVRHAPGACILEISLNEQHLRISVTDTSRTLPEARAARFDGSGGLGLHLLRAMARTVETAQHADGKTVSVQLDRVPSPSGRSLGDESRTDGPCGTPRGCGAPNLPGEFRPQAATARETAAGAAASGRKSRGAVAWA
jgi:anti-sigma regulatory factor (Ser/Thr protein kinase)